MYFGLVLKQKTLKTKKSYSNCGDGKDNWPSNG